MGRIKDKRFRIPLFLRKEQGDVPYYTLVKRIFGVKPNNVDLYKLALVHKSASVILEDGSTINNERLEFLGDAVIETIVSEMLFIEYPDSNEGILSKLRSKIVSRQTLNGIALELGLDREMVIHPSGLGTGRNNIYGDALEAMVGALYLDQGYNRTNRILIDRVFGRHLDLETLVETELDFKSRVIEWGQKHHVPIEFKSFESEDHAELTPHFETVLLINGEQKGHGDGRSKKEAEQKASETAYAELDIGNGEQAEI